MVISEAITTNGSGRKIPCGTEISPQATDNTKLFEEITHEAARNSITCGYRISSVCL